MVSFNLIFLVFLLLFFLIIIIRYFELVPILFFWIKIKEKTFKSDFSNIFIEKGQLIELPIDEDSFHIIFFQSNLSEDLDKGIGILMITSWIEDNFFTNLKTAYTLQKAGYHVIFPLYHKLDQAKNSFSKITFHPKICQRIIQISYEYMISNQRPEINKRRVGVYSESWGIFLASRLIKFQSIKACAFENGPAEFSTLLLNSQTAFLQKIVKIVTSPFLWQTVWRSSDRVIKNIRECPTFLISSRENKFGMDRKQIWKLYRNLYLRCPRQLYFEHAILPLNLKETWEKEYFFQLQNFFDSWLIKSPKYPDLHFDYKILSSRLIKGKKAYNIEIKITSIPPVFDSIPLQILLADKRGKTSELRVWFSGAEMKFNHIALIKPNVISICVFKNIIEVTDFKMTMTRQWVKKDVETALYKTIETLINLPLKNLEDMLESYFFIKSVLLSELGLKSEAKRTLEKRIKKHFWKNMTFGDSDVIALLNEN